MKASPKIILFAFHSVTNLKHYWETLKNRADCVWVTFCPHVVKDLKAIGVEQVHFRNMWGVEFPFIWLSRAVNFFYSYYIRHQLNEVMSTLLDSLRPDILISDVGLMPLRYEPLDRDVMMVEVFHSVCYKKYFLCPLHLEYDLLLLPGVNHSQRLLQRYKDYLTPHQMKIVGWPRADGLTKAGLSTVKKQELLSSIGLDPSRKTVLYAPTYDAFLDNGLFPHAFGEPWKAFEIFCSRMCALGVNLIVKLHPLSAKLIRHPRLHKIADRYGVCLAYRKSSFHLDNAMENWLHLSDLLVSDVSGIILDFMVLDKPVVFIEPDGAGFSWNDADIPSALRAGEVVNSLETLVQAVEQSLQEPQKHRMQRHQMLEQVLGHRDGGAAQRGAEAVLDYYPTFVKSLEDPAFRNRRSHLKTRLRQEFGYLDGMQ